MRQVPSAQVKTINRRHASWTNSSRSAHWQPLSLSVSRLSKESLRSTSCPIRNNKSHNSKLHQWPNQLVPQVSITNQPPLLPRTSLAKPKCSSCKLGLEAWQASLSYWIKRQLSCRQCKIKVLVSPSSRLRWFLAIRTQLTKRPGLVDKMDQATICRQQTHQTICSRWTSVEPVRSRPCHSFNSHAGFDWAKRNKCNQWNLTRCSADPL